MRNRKRIEELELKLSNLEDDFLTLKFTVSNPPKYRKGNKVKGKIITGVLVVEKTRESIYQHNGYEYLYCYTDLKTGELGNFIE